MGFQFDLDKIRVLPKFSKATSRKMWKAYECDAKQEDHPLFTPVIPVKKASKQKEG